MTRTLCLLSCDDSHVFLSYAGPITVEEYNSAVQLAWDQAVAEAPSGADLLVRDVFPLLVTELAKSGFEAYQAPIGIKLTGSDPA